MTEKSPFEHMQAAVDIVDSSPHPTNKVAATLAGKDLEGQSFSISRTNHWPDVIRKKLGENTRIGNSSGTIHAETQVLLNSPLSQDGTVYITDPPCPNCVKNMAEAGIKALYLDHKGFDKDFAQRRGHHFESMSMQICEKSGIAVYKIFRKEQRIEDIYAPKPGYTPALEKPVHIQSLSELPDHNALTELISQETERFDNRPFALAASQTPLGLTHLISAEIHPVIGYTSKAIESKSEKYSFLLQPLNRIMMSASRFGFRLLEKTIYSSRVPTSRELVNYVGAGFTSLMIGNTEHARDDDGLTAAELLAEKHILEIKRL